MLNFESFSTGRGTKSDSSRALPIFKARTPFACLCFSRRFCFLTRHLADESRAVVHLRSEFFWVIEVDPTPENSFHCNPSRQLR